MVSGDIFPLRKDPESQFVLSNSTGDFPRVHTLQPDRRINILAWVATIECQRIGDFQVVASLRFVLCHKCDKFSFAMVSVPVSICCQPDPAVDLLNSIP